MPLYDLECSACGHTFEVFQAMDARQPTRCEKCGKRKARRVLVRPPATHNNYSPMHPRKNRGSGIGRRGH
jgi:putative FmdB family regulatory protein